MVVKFKIHGVKKKVLLYLCNHDAVPNKDIGKALGIEGVYITRALQQLEPYVITTLDKGNTRPRSLKKDRVTFEYLMYNFVLTEHMTEFLQSSYVQNLDIHGLEIDQLIVGTITTYLDIVGWLWKMFCTHPKLADQLDAAIAADASDNSAAKLLSRYTQELSGQMDAIPQLIPLLSNLPQFYDVVISPDIRSDSSVLLPNRDSSELKVVLKKDMKTILSEK
ncbi:MAG: hypothetical protein U9N46_02605 [Euryarchaeota archaeon]|nr:MAG: hypothetical protein C5S47_05610 [ANME-2 cluster archaeon]MEA1864081.1 hypothetical protein [Euryarchaeota archaeon]